MRASHKPEGMGEEEYHRRRKDWERLKQRAQEEGLPFDARWAADFRNFFADLGRGAPGEVVRRLVPELGWVPGNCMWAPFGKSLPNHHGLPLEHVPADGYVTIFDYAAEAQKTIAELLALHVINDPFYAGMPSRKAGAPWFADHWYREGFTLNTHVRRCHYRLISKDPPPADWNGRPYLNTDSCWHALCRASRDARYLDYVDKEDFADRRNRGAIEQGIEPPPPAELIPQGHQAHFLHMPEKLPLPTLHLDAETMQPYHLEIWVEKSTIADIIDEIAARYGSRQFTMLVRRRLPRR
jgi:hypothetical protein